MKQAIGLLETKGLISLVEATDAMLKAANVEVKNGMKAVGSAYVSVQVEGDVASVKSAIEAGAEAAQRSGEVVSAHVIARPYENQEAGASKATGGRKR